MQDEENGQYGQPYEIGHECGGVYSALVIFFTSSFVYSGVYSDTTAVIVTLVLTGRFLEQLSKGRASEYVRTLMDFQSRLAHVIREEENESPIEQIRVDKVFIDYNPDFIDSATIKNAIDKTGYKSHMIVDKMH